MSKQLVSPKAMPPETELFTTTSIFAAAFCLCAGLKLQDMDRRKGPKITFVFEGKDATAKAKGFFNGAKIEARAYAESYRSLKDQIFQPR